MNEENIENKDIHSQLLVRIDEKIHALDVKFTKFNGDFLELKRNLESNYVNQLEFKPIRDIVKYAVGIILAGVLGSIIYLVIK
ncbi:MAG: hypothetical protein AABY22_10315 [Nanoarchaeota archaeon]